MKLKKLYIEDFGVFSHQRLDDLASGIVVIGGLNRAGKTSFVDILRYLGYGFPRDNSIPEPKFNYKVDADISLETKEEYTISLEGYKDPKLYSNGQQESTKQIADIYNHLDQFAYQQLFTLGLDEIQHVSRQDGDKLQAILLGSGLSDVVQAEQLITNLSKGAAAIGGKRGERNVYKFKPYYQRIQEGLSLKESALSDVDLYYNTQEQLSKVEEDIDKRVTKQELLQAKLILLDLLKSNFSDYQLYLELKWQVENYQGRVNLEQNNAIKLKYLKELREKYLDLRARVAKRRIDFEEELNCDNSLMIKEEILALSEEISYSYKQVTVLKERINNLKELKENNYQAKLDLITQIESLNSNWSDQWSDFQKLNLDQIAENKIEQLITYHQEFTDKGERLAKELDRLENEEEVIIKHLRGLKIGSVFSNLKYYNFISMIVIGLGVVLSTLNLWLGISVISAGSLSLISYLFFRFNSFNKNRSLVEELELKVKQLAEKSRLKREELQQVEAELDYLNQELDDYRQRLKLDTDTSLYFIKDFFRKCQNINYQLLNYQKRVAEYNRKEREITAKLDQMKYNFALLWNSLDYRKLEEQDTVEVSKIIFKRVDDLDKYLELAKSWQQAELRRDDLEVEIDQLIPEESTEIIKGLENSIVEYQKYEKFRDLKDKLAELRYRLLAVLSSENNQAALALSLEREINQEQAIDYFYQFAKDYSIREEVIEAYQELKVKIEFNKDKLEELKQEKQIKVDLLNKLATTEKLVEAQAKIDQARSDLHPLAKEFAIKRSATFILEKVRSRFISQVKDQLLAPSSKILEELTRGEYREILAQENLLENDFKLELAGDRQQNSTETLSRATQEQVFLAVRMSRIQDINPPLPVVFDDAFVNFDTYHLEKVVDLLVKLARNNQIFVLTCHPALIEYIAKKANNAQYWKLSAGEFSLSNHQELLNYLSR